MSVASHPRASGLVFLSGGSALTGLATLLAESGLHAAHLISVFDNGGSAGRLREVCGGIAIGDIRKRLIAIGDRSTESSRHLISLLSARVPSHGSRRALRGVVEAIACGTSDLLKGIPPAAAGEISQALAHTVSALPATFDWRDTSIGNLLLAGRYLQLRDWGLVLTWACGIVSSCGTVIPVSTEPAHLGARLANGRYVLGQSVLTDEAAPIEAPIESLGLYHTDQSSAESIRVSANNVAVRELKAARTIVYSWGSFYTSVLCALLVRGIGQALAANPVPKLLMLNPFADAETAGKQPADLVQELRRYGGLDSGQRAASLVTHVLALRVTGVSRAGFYDARHRAQLERLGVRVIELESQGLPRADDLRRVMECLLALTRADCDAGSLGN